jgi:hypothetical protein
MMKEVFRIMFLVLAAVAVNVECFTANKQSSLKDLLTDDWLQRQASLLSTKESPLTKTVFCIPPDCISDQVSFIQKSTNTRIQGLSSLQSACQQWEQDFQTDLGDVTMCTRRLSRVSPTTLLFQWNVTWVPPTTAWLESLANSWPGVTPCYAAYTHLAGQRTSFSYRAVFDLFADAFKTGQLRVPLACIEGTTTLEFDSSFTTLKSIVEDLGYAQDLARGGLQNRKCASDLRLFLETGRRVGADADNWYEAVSNLSWMSVPGMNPMDMDPQDDGPMAPLVFLGVTGATILGFAALVAPELIGQSLFGPPNYIVRPEDLNSIY